jgi:uncharacterized membrane protein
MDWITVGAQWLHVLLGIFWFGNAMAVAAFLIPAISPLPIETQRLVGSRYADIAERTFNVVAPTVILLGIIRGTLLGQVKSLESLTTTYGYTWLVALVAAIATFLWGRFIIGGAARAMNAAPLDAHGGPTPALEAATSRLKRVAVLELLGFVVIFTCMILMRFGL